MQKNVSRFMRKTLMPDEKLIADARFHAYYTFSACVGFVICLAVGMAVQYAMARYADAHTFMPSFVGAGVGAWILFWMLLKKWTTEIILTDRRLLFKQGFFAIQVAEVDIEQLASDNVEQSLLGRVLDFGAIHIRCIEASDVYLPPVAKPYEFRNALELEKKAYREKYMSIERLRHHGMNPGDR